jgi:hypothetical protein
MSPETIDDDSFENQQALVKLADIEFSKSNVTRFIHIFQGKADAEIQARKSF